MWLGTLSTNPHPVIHMRIARQPAPRWRRVQEGLSSTTFYRIKTMSGWSYRVVRREGVLAIHEVFEVDGEVIPTMEPVPVKCDDNQNLQIIYTMMGAALDKPVLDWDTL